MSHENVIQKGPCRPHVSTANITRMTPVRHTSDMIWYAMDILYRVNKQQFIQQVIIEPGQCSSNSRKSTTWSKHHRARNNQTGCQNTCHFNTMSPTTCFYMYSQNTWTTLHNSSERIISFFSNPICRIHAANSCYKTSAQNIMDVSSCWKCHGGRIDMTRHNTLHCAMWSMHFSLYIVQKRYLAAMIP